MDSITLENYRCFGEKQTVRLAPLTLLVGENSTGKTSFLALIRALWDVAITERVPDFREEPYDLGSFREIAHNRGARGSRADSFEASFESTSRGKSAASAAYGVRFREWDASIYPVERWFSAEGSWCALNLEEPKNPSFQIGVHEKKWEYHLPNHIYSPDDISLFPLEIFLFEITRGTSATPNPNWLVEPASGAHPVGGDYEAIRKLHQALRVSSRGHADQRPFASAPVHSRPRRTYDPIRRSRDPEGESTPSYLAELYRRDPNAWNDLKGNLEAFGRASGLFHEVAIKSFGNNPGSPFQVEIRKFDSGTKGPRRNLIDVGYGVSQSLPVLTELFRKDSPSTLLLQQPEVHLHPSAQAALGSLFCSVSGPEKQLIVETHSDYIVDRVRIEIREKRILPHDVSILFFERTGLDVKIHSLQIDELGNVPYAPPSYGRFFMDELNRSVGL